MIPNFAANIMAPIDKAIADNRSIEDIAGIIEEIRMFACPNCGHITPDHRWTPPSKCLIESCPCDGELIDLWAETSVPGYETALIEKIDSVIRGKIA